MFSSWQRALDSKGRSDVQDRRLLIEVETLTLFSHSNSVHMLRNCKLDKFSQNSSYRGTIGSGRTYLSLVAVTWSDVIENIDVNVVQHNALTVVRDRCSIVEDVSKDDASLR